MEVEDLFLPREGRNRLLVIWREFKRTMARGYRNLRFKHNVKCPVSHLLMGTSAGYLKPRYRDIRHLLSGPIPDPLTRTKPEILVYAFAQNY